MKKLLLALALLLLPSAAFGQCNGIFGANQVCGSLAGGPPGPVNSSSFPTGLVVGSTVISGGSSTGILYNNSGVLGADAGLTWVPGGPVTISPTANTFNRGVSISQSGPTSGSTTVTTGESFNLLAGSHNSTVTCASNTNPFADRGYWCNAVTLLKVEFTVGGANVGAGPGAAGGTISPIIGQVINTVPMNTINDLVGLGGLAFSSSTNSGLGGLFGAGAAVICNGCTWNQVTGFEIDVGFFNAPTVPIRTGLNLVSQNSTARGSVLDTAFWIVSSQTSGNFNRLFSIAGTPSFPLSTTADVFTFDGAMTIANVFNAAGSCSGTAPAQGPCNVTVTGNILNFPGVTLSGAAALTLSNNGAASITVINNQNATSAANVTNTSTGTAGAAIFSATNSAGNSAIFGLTSTGFTPSGPVGANFVLLRSLSIAAGIVIEADGANPIIFGTNLTEVARMRLGFMVGTTTDPGAGIVNVATGFRIGNLAANRHYLCGNGTNYIDCTIQAGDLPSPYGATTYTTNGVLYGNGSSNIQATAQGAANSILTANAGAPVFSQTPVIQTSLGVGGVSPLNSLLLVTGNATQVNANIGDAINATLQIVAANGSTSSLKLNGFGTGNPTTIVPTMARGTAASPTALAAPDAIFGFAGYGYDGAQYDVVNAFSFIVTAVVANTNMSSATRFLNANANALHAIWITSNGGLSVIDSITYPADPGAGSAIMSGHLQVGNSANATLSTGEFDLAKISASGTAPGAANLKLAAVAGTNAGTCKIISYAGTSTTPVTVVDNIGGGC